MNKQSKAIGAAVGAIVGGIASFVLIALGVTQEVGVPVEYQPVVDMIAQALTTMLTAYAGSWLAPKNAA